MAGLLAAQTVRTIAHLDSKTVQEASGIAASRQNPGIYWTHNDSGNTPHIFSFNRQGHVTGKWLVPKARNVDWEDIAIGPGPSAGKWYLYIGDTGDNDHNRTEVAVYRIEEPKTGADEKCKNECTTGAPTVLRLRYPDRGHNAETLMVHPKTGDLYIVTKGGGGDIETLVFVARVNQLTSGQAIALAEIGELDIPEPVFRRLAGGISGGDISPDGRRVALCDYFRMYEAVLPAGAKFDDIWKRPFTATALGTKLQVEGIAYQANGESILAISEGSHAPLLEIVPATPATRRSPVPDPK
jgi:hypothetical protein